MEATGFNNINRIMASAPKTVGKMDPKDLTCTLNSIKNLLKVNVNNLEYTGDASLERKVTEFVQQVTDKLNSVYQVNASEEKTIAGTNNEGFIMSIQQGLGEGVEILKGLDIGAIRDEIGTNPQFKEIESQRVKKFTGNNDEKLSSIVYTIQTAQDRVK